MFDALLSCMKTLLVNKHEAVIYLPNKAPFSIYCSKGKVLDAVDAFLAPTGQSDFKTYSEYTTALSLCKEDTQVIKVA